MKNLNSFVQYHGYNIGYRDGTRQIIHKTCSRPTYNPFWKNPEHITYRVTKSARVQLKHKPVAFKKDFKSYINKFILGHSAEARQVLNYVGDYSSSESYTDSDSDNESDYYSLPETNCRMSNLTGDNLVIDIKPEADDKTPDIKPDTEQKPKLKQNPNNKQQKIPADNTL